jgi:hypothetical protein
LRKPFQKNESIGGFRNAAGAMGTDQERSTSDSTGLDALHRFCRLVAASSAHQSRLQACSTPEDILAMAAELDCLFPRQTLRSCSRDLAADHWPWAQKGQIWRQQFFME